MCYPSVYGGGKDTIRLSFFIAEVWIIVVIAVFLFSYSEGVNRIYWTAKTPTPGSLSTSDIPHYNSAIPASQTHRYGLMWWFANFELLIPFIFVLPIALNLIAFKKPEAFALNVIGFFVFGLVLSLARGLFLIIMIASPSDWWLSYPVSGTEIPYHFWIILLGQAAYIALAFIGIAIEVYVLRTGSWARQMETIRGILEVV